MITFSLQSGSNGNCIYVEAGGVRLLFDAGISGKTALGRLRVHGRDGEGLSGLIISHDHADHIRSAGVFHRKFHIPIYATRRTFHAVEHLLGPVQDVRYFEAGRPIRFDGATVHTIPTPHDATEGVAFVVEHADRRLGILTDLGHPFAELKRVLSELDAAYLESNYDPEMLAGGPYPYWLKQRISGPQGHLSNEESADLLRACGRRLRWAAIAHLSEDNNSPELAMKTHRRCAPSDLKIHLASRYDVSPVHTIQ